MIAVTGATGLLGRVLVFDLLKENQKVRALYRGSSDLEAVKAAFLQDHGGTLALWDQIEWIQVDFDDIDTLIPALDGAEQVYHCAGYVSFDPKEEKRLEQTNAKGTENLMYALEGSSVKSLLHVSSIAVLDGVSPEGTVDESCDFNPKLRHSPYAISKHIAELEVMRASAEGLRVVVVSPGIILGLGTGMQSSGSIFKKYKNLSFVPKGGSNYVDVRDVSKASRLLMQSAPQKDRYILVSEHKSNLWIGTFIRKAFDLPAPREIPSAVLWMGYGLSRLLGWLISPLRWLSYPNIKALTSKSQVSSQRFKAEFDYEFIPVEQSLLYHLNQYKNKTK